MSTAERTRPPKLLPPLVAGEHLDQPTFHERFEAMPPGTWAELVDGVVYMPSPMRHDHGQESRVVAGWLDSYQRLTPGVDGGDGSTLKLDLRGEPQADHHLRIPADAGGQSRIDEEGYIAGAPELVVEVARSTRSFDLNAKKADYERVGVREYLVVELDPNRIHWFVRRGDHFEDLSAGPDGIYRSEVFPGLWLDPRALYAQDRDRLYRILRRGVRSADHAVFAARVAPPRRKRGRP
jgi:Uma2 family endonuclease